MADPTFEELMSMPDTGIKLAPSFDEISSLPDYDESIGIKSSAKKPSLLQDINTILDKSRNDLSDIYMQFGEQEKQFKASKSYIRPSPFDYAAHTVIQGAIAPIVDTFAAEVSHAARGIYDTTVDAGIPLKESAKSLGNTLSLIVPDFIEEPAKKAIIAGIDLASKKLGDTVEGYEKLKKDDPATASWIEGIVDVGLMYSPAKTKRAATPSVMSRITDPIETAAKKQRFDNIVELASPIETQDVFSQARREGRIKTEGLFGIKKIDPSDETIEIAKVIEKIPTVKPRYSVTKNSNAIQDYLDNSVKIVQSQLDRIKIPIATITTVANRRIDNAVMNLSRNETISGNAQAYAVDIANKAKQFIAEENNTLGGMYKARKRLDLWIKAQKNNVLDDAAKRSALSVASKEIRNSMNDMVIDGYNMVYSGRKKPFDLATKIKEQHLLINSLEDSIDVKAFREPSSKIGAAYQNAARVLKLRDTAVRDWALIAGATSYGASMAIAPYTPAALAIGAATATGHTMAKAHVTKELVIKTLKLVDKALPVATNKDMIKTLRAERAFLIDYVNNYERYAKQEESSNTQ